MRTNTLRMFCVAIVAAMLSALPAVAQNEQITKVVTKGVADSLALLRTSISFADEVLLHDMDLSIISIDSTAVPELDYGMYNVSVEGEGYRFLPHGTHFDGDGATVRLGYDRTRIPSGYSEDDIRTYYYDADKKSWVALQLVDIDKQQSCVVSKTTHFTDMINGVIVAPESPETRAFIPTMMNDILAADPTSKINIITPPTANNRGSANLQYPFEMPPARNGMQPQVALSYNSDGGCGWAGEGWDISIPAITIDTRWGVPRYNTSYETETYLFNGQMLAMMKGNDMTVAHRTDSVLRKEDRQFFMRQGGDFNLIVRKGDNPSNYYWEITDRNGVVYTYGGDENARLRGLFTDVNGNQRQVIAEWKLTRIEEPHGDFVVYEYEDKNTTQETVMGGFVTSPVYLKNIHVYQKKYLESNTDSIETTTVSFLPLLENENLKLKALQANNARYGFLTSSNRLLGEVVVKFLGETLRTYPLEYNNDTTFHKDLLRKITHLDDNGNIVSFQKFDYYDDVNDASNFIPYQSNTEILNLHDDLLNAGFINLLHRIGDFSDNATAIGGTKSKNTGISLYAGVGPNDNNLSSKSNTGGVSFSYSYSSSSGVSTLADIDGDGVLDKVFIEDGTLKYRSSLMANSVVSIDGIKDFLKTSSHTIGAGYKFHPSIHGITFIRGEDFSYSKSKTDTYFADVNGDGLIDIVNKGKVYFNCTEYVDGILNTHFSLSSADSPSPIINIGDIDTSATEATVEEIEDAVANSPMVDMVRVWVAPYDGNIQISGAVELLPPEEDDEYGADGIWYSIQHNDIELVSDSIRFDDVSPHSASVAQRQVTKGDKIFFRLQSGRHRLSDGSSDRVNWNPVVKYIGKPNYTTPNGHLLYTFDSKESEVVSDTTIVPFRGSQSLMISGYLDKQYTSDDITLRVYTSSERYDSVGNPQNYTRHKVYERTFSWNEDYCDSLSFPIVYHINENYIECEVYSTSNVAWDKIKWFPVLMSDSDSIALPVAYSIYADNLVEGSPISVVANQTITLGLQGRVYNPSDANGDIIMTVKSSMGYLYGKKLQHVVNGQITNDETITITPTATGHIWVELFTEDRKLAQAFENPNSQILTPINLSSICPVSETPLMGPYVIVQSINSQNTDIVSTNLFTITEEKRFGPLYRGWGQFAYNTGTDNRYATPIDTSLLKLFDSNISINDTLDVRTITFSLANPDNETQNRWYGPNHDVFITGTTMGASRLGIKDVALSNPLANVGNIETYTGTKWIGTSARGIPLISTSDSWDDLFETSVEIGTLGASVSRNEANGASHNKTSFFDLNGDGYPDIVSGDMIQYTNTHGGFSGEKYNGIGGESGINNAIQYGVGGNALHSFSLGTHEGNADSGAEKNSNSDENAKNMTIGFNAGVNIGLNDDFSHEAFIDINGDGLPDKVKDDGTARINLGYSFTNPIPWGVDTVQKTHSFRIDPEAGLSLPFSIDKNASSFSAGIGISSMGSQSEYSMFDVNGDGLPDAINKSNNHINVALNLGSSFAAPILWQNTSEINKSTSTSESVNAAFTLGIPIVTSGIKVAINTGAYYGHSMSRPRFELRDIDGDGFIDILESNSEDTLKVRRSTIARTNKLKSVTNSLGGKFTLDYKHNTPTYGLPGGKWVMSSVDIDYGIHGDYEIPNTKNVFEYNNGRRDRHEREFLGFGQVITKNIDTRDMSLYRQTVEEYDTCSIYTAGNLLRTYVAKPTGAKLTEVENGYYSYGLTNSVASGVNGGNYKFNEDFQLWNDRGSAYTPLKYTKNMQYEGSVNGTVMSKSWNSYYTRNGEHGLLKDYRYSDKGTLNDDGTGNYDYKTVIDYSNKLTGTNYYFGHPQRVIVRKGIDLYHLTEATYSSAFPSQPTCVKHAVDVKIENPDPDVPVGSGSVGGGSVTNPNILPPTIYTPDTHEDSVSYGALNYAQTNFEYDDFGNLTRVILPEGSDSTRVYYEYIYEDTLSTYIREVDDIFGLNSIDMSHDFRYGITNLTIDQNGARYLVTNDNIGRMSAVRSPNELDADNMTMLFEYNPIAIVDNGVIIKPASATTTYYFRRKYRNSINEETDVKSMKITTFVDGFGRVIETRKESNIRTE